MDSSGLIVQWNSCVRALELGEDLLADPLAPKPTANIALHLSHGTEASLHDLVQAFPQALLPVLFDSDGAWLPAPAWGRGPRFLQPRLSFPPQPSRVVGDSSILTSCKVVVVPAVAVDFAGNRMGHGGGWYDRALAGLPSSVRIVAVVWDDEVTADLSQICEAHDVSVDAVITPHRMFLCH